MYLLLGNAALLVPAVPVHDNQTEQGEREGLEGDGQCFRSGLEPIQSGQWIQIRIRNPDTDVGGQNDPQI